MGEDFLDRQYSLLNPDQDFWDILYKDKLKKKYKDIKLKP